jgi:two-component system response regulator HupR/HoxA
MLRYMDSNNTVLVVASSLGLDGRAWATLVESLTRACEFRVLHARSFDEATQVLSTAQVDLVIAEQTASAPGGCAFLAGLRASHPDVVRVLAFDGEVGDLSHAAVYQFLRVPLDAEQACLVVKRGLEARELSRPHGIAAVRNPTLSFPWGSGGHTLKAQVQTLEKYLVHETLERCQWNQSKAAGQLGLSRVGLANKIRRYGLAES